MENVIETLQFVYSGMDEDLGGLLLCCVKAIGATVVISFISIFGVYLLLTTAFLFCCVTVIPIIIISAYWDGFWFDLKYSYIWFWLVGFTVSGVISGLAFLPIWFVIALIIVGIALAAATAVGGVALAVAAGCICLAAAGVCLAVAIPVAIIALPIYLVYLSIPYCSVFWKQCCRESGKCIGNCCVNCCECLGECCTGCCECLGECCEYSGKCIGKCCSGCYKCSEECLEEGSNTSKLVVQDVEVYYSVVVVVVE